MKRVYLLVLGLAMSLLLPSLAVAETIVKVGNILPLSGPSASVGMQGKQAREMAIEEINAAGGIKSLGGAKLELLFADSKSDPNVGVTEAERLINTEKVNVLTGAWNSGVTYPSTAVASATAFPTSCPCPCVTPSPSAASRTSSASRPRTPGGPVISSPSSTT
nr:ABC transporter substrate-binding protein [Pseudodesulfovibrio cashew]